MASVHSSRAAKCARRGLEEDEAPDHVLSAGELLIKQLAQKQSKTDISLEEQLKDGKKFERGIGCVSISEFLPGRSSLREFEERQLRAEKIQELEGQGLTKEEAKAIVLDCRQSKASAFALSASNLHVQQLLSASNSSTRCELSVSRREMELAASVKPDSVETRLYKFAVQNTRAVQTQPLGHPIYGLGDMELSLTREAVADPQKLAKTVRRKRRQLIDAMSEPAGVHYKPPEPRSSLWDCIEPPVIISRQPTRPTSVATCQRETLYTVKNGRIIPLKSKDKVSNENVDKDREKLAGQAFVALELPAEISISGRLTEQEIRQLPRFENYERGAISNILYLKNLSNSVTEEDLVAVFSKFQEHNQDKIVFRLMTGKMRGQAFVTFKSCELATKALEEVNGIIVKGKPIVIQYGRNQT